MEVTLVAVPDVDTRPLFAALMVGVDCVELDELLFRPAWQADAACHEHPEISFFPRRGESIRPAVDVCRQCLVRRDCLEFALAGTVNGTVGVWGGTSERQRRAARRHRWSVDWFLAEVERFETELAVEDLESEWTTAPCAGCGGLLSRKDLAAGDGWCWACRPSG